MPTFLHVDSTHLQVRRDVTTALRVNENKFESVDSLKFLGIVINPELKWHEHINVMCNKITKHIDILYKVHYNPLHILKI